MSILRIDSSVRKEGSYSRKLSDKLIAQISRTLQNNGKNADVVVRDLAEGIPLIDSDWSMANFTNAEERTPLQDKQLELSEKLVEELNQADTVVIGVPIYNFNIPTTLKAWIDQVVRVKRTFQYTENGPVGLVSNKKVYIIVVSGGTRLNSDIDFVSAYLRHILGFIGITDITLIDSSGLGKNESETLGRVEHIIEQI